MTEFWNAVQPTVATAVVTVVGAAITALGGMAVAVLNKWRQQVAAKIGADTYNKNLAVAKQIWGAVDEYFRITPTAEKTVESATAKFAELMRKALPSVTDDEVKQLQAVVAGQVNAGRAALTAPAPDVSVSTVSLPTDTADAAGEVEGTDTPTTQTAKA